MKPGSKLFDLQRNKIVHSYVYDDIIYTSSVLYALKLVTGYSFEEISEKINESELERLLSLAPYFHCYIFEEAIMEVIDSFLESAPYTKVDLSECRVKAGILSRLTAMLCINKNLPESKVLSTILKSELCELMFDTRTAFPITPANLLLEDSEQFLDFET